MTHIARQEQLDGKVVAWMEHVSDEQYRRPRAPQGVRADSLLECVGSQESMMQAIEWCRPSGFVSYVGVPHDVELKGANLFFTHAHCMAAPLPCGGICRS